MGVTVKTKQTGKQTGALENLGVSAKLVDEIGSLDEQIAAAEAKIAPYREQLAEKMAEALASVDEHVDPSDETVLKGATFAIEYGKMGERAELKDQLGAAKLLEKVEKGLAIKLASFKITDLRKYLTPALVDSVCETGFKIKRRTKIKRIAT